MLFTYKKIALCFHLRSKYYKRDKLRKIFLGQFLIIFLRVYFSQLGGVATTILYANGTIVSLAVDFAQCKCAIGGRARVCAKTIRQCAQKAPKLNWN